MGNLNINRYMYYIVRSWYLGQRYQKLIKHADKMYMQIVTQNQIEQGLTLTKHTHKLYQ